MLYTTILGVAFQIGFATFASLAENAMKCTYLSAGTRDLIVDLGQKYQEALGDTSIRIETHLPIQRVVLLR